MDRAVREFPYKRREEIVSMWYQEYMIEKRVSNVGILYIRCMQRVT